MVRSLDDNHYQSAVFLPPSLPLLPPSLHVRALTALLQHAPLTGSASVPSLLGEYNPALTGRPWNKAFISQPHTVSRGPHAPPAASDVKERWTELCGPLVEHQNRIQPIVPFKLSRHQKGRGSCCWCIVSCYFNRLNSSLFMVECCGAGCRWW